MMLNQIIFVGEVTDIKKQNKLIEHFRVKIKRPEEGHDKPRVHLNSVMKKRMTKYIKKGMTIGVKAHLHTEKKGRYGLVQTIYADKLTFISQPKDDC